jgi:hypothetical protein
VGEGGDTMTEQQQIEQLTSEIERLNCFNGKHHSGIPEDFRNSMSVALAAWDEIRRTL